MADNFTDMISNLEGKSLEELGSSLLNRQSDINRKRAKQAKKSRRMSQALAILGVGQKLFKNAYNKRAKEIEDLKIFEIANNNEQAKRINGMSNLLSAIPDNFMVDKPLEERVNAYMETPQADIFEEKLGPTVDKMLKNMSMFEGFNQRAEYNTTRENLTKEAAKYFFENNRYKNFENELSKLYDAPDMDRISLLEKGMGLTVSELTKAERKYYDNLKQQYRNRGILQGLKDIGRKLGRRADKKGELNLFRNIDNLDLYGSMDEALDELQLAPRLQLSLDKAIANYKQTDDFIGMKADNRVDLQNAIKGQLSNIAMLANTRSALKKDDILLMGPNKGKDFYQFYDAISKNEFASASYIRDISKLVVAFEEPEGIELAKNMYIANMERIGKTPSQENIDDFIEKITSEDKSEVIKFAAIMVGNNGFKRIKKPLKDIRTYDSSGLLDDLDKDYTYDVFNNPLSSILDDGIKTPEESKSGTYEIDDNWNKLNDYSKQLSFDKHVTTILSSKIKDANKELLLENLFEKIPEPQALNFEEYMSYYDKKYLDPRSVFYKPILAAKEVKRRGQ